MMTPSSSKTREHGINWVQNQMQMNIESDNFLFNISHSSIIQQK